MSAIRELLLDDEDEGYIEGQQILIDHVLDELNEEIDSCKHVLGINGILSINKVIYETNNFPIENQRIRIKQVISHLSIEYAASSSELCTIMLETVRFILTDKSLDDTGGVELLRKYLDNDVKELVKNKQCNILIRKVKCELEKIYKDHNSQSKIKKKVIKYINFFQSDRVDKIDKIAKFSKPLFKKNESILLISYSSTVIASLKNIPKSIRKGIDLYICECSNKNRYNHTRNLIHCDGDQYCKALCDESFRSVNIIPDISVGTYMDNGTIDMVLFGAIVVDVSSNRIANTSGHLTIIHIAKSCHIPIYVFADTYKFGKINPLIDNRLNSWLSSLVDIKNELYRNGIELLNPRVEFFKMKHISSFVTDQGILSNKKVSKIMK